MTVDEAIARLRGTDGGDCEASADGLGGIADVVSAEVERLRSVLCEIAAHCKDTRLTSYPSRTFDMLHGIASRAAGATPPASLDGAFVVRHDG